MNDLRMSGPRNSSRPPTIDPSAAEESSGSHVLFRGKPLPAALTLAMLFLPALGALLGILL